MTSSCVALVALQFVMHGGIQNGQRIEGTVVNGSRGRVPMPGVEVILRAGEAGALAPVAKTISDGNGNFVFESVPAQTDFVYVPGANHQSIHYPGTPISKDAYTRFVVEVFDTVTSPSPLVADRHELDIRVKSGVLEIEETILVNNPTMTTYVGAAEDDGGITTLSLFIPDGTERVTFASEFHGRRFQVGDKRLVTAIPWTPGKRELKFSYSLPVESGRKRLERKLDLPCSTVTVRVHGDIDGDIDCNLAALSDGPADTHTFTSSGSLLPAGFAITVQLGELPVPWIVKARWAALAVLAVLIVGTTVVLRSRKSRLTGQQPVRTGMSDVYRNVRPRAARAKRARVR